MEDLRGQLIETAEEAIDRVHDMDVTHHDYAVSVADAVLELLKDAVKPLEWDWACEYGMICQAKTPIGTYSIHQDEDSAGGALLMYLHLTDDGDCTRYAVEWREYVDPEEFQAIAQADYSRRILAAFGVKP